MIWREVLWARAPFVTKTEMNNIHNKIFHSIKQVTQDTLGTTHCIF